MVLSTMPRVDRLILAVVTRVPDWHPEHGHFEPFPVHAWLVHHPAGPILVDTGVGPDNRLINEWYEPEVTPLVEALGAVGVAPDGLQGLILSHLHFDHCGQQGLIEAPVYVQAAEVEAAEAPHYSVPEWSRIPSSRLRALYGDSEVVDGVRLLSTPGHTAGHQSVVIEGGGERLVLAAQCALRATELMTGDPDPSNLPDPSSTDVARRSLDRIRSLGPCRIELSHDPETVELNQSGLGQGVPGSGGSFADDFGDVEALDGTDGRDLGDESGGHHRQHGE